MTSAGIGKVQREQLLWYFSLARAANQPAPCCR